MTNTLLPTDKPSSSFSKMTPRRWPLAVAAVWFVLVMVGLTLLWRYANTPNPSMGSELTWPGSKLIGLNRQEATLVMFVHPHCPCSQASLSELERLLAQCPGGMEPWIVFYKPSSAPSAWEESDLWHRAKSIPGLHVVTDVDGQEAKRFHAATSGQTFVYDPEGDLLFSGGITLARGHEGDNVGRDSIVSLLNNGSCTTRETPVFGCPILQEAKPDNSR
jgi:hypothetical protein